MLRENVQNRLGSLTQLTGRLELLEEAAATAVAEQGRLIPEVRHCWSEQ